LRQTDSELVEATLGGDREAFGQLVERYERGVCAVIVQIVGDTHAAQDVAQEVFLKAYRNLAHLRRPSAFASWLFQIARRLALNWLRQRPTVQEMPIHEGVSAGERNGRLDETSAQLLNAVMGLPRQERRVVMLRYFDGYAIRDIAEILGRPVGTVTKQLSRAHARLRRELEARRR
jgi:RNA polymerase sigma-70 factor (ECF subfamily)